MILAGDVGGTKTNLGLFARHEDGLRLLRASTFQSADFPGLAPVLKAFLESPGPTSPSLSAACFGIAGPVIDNRVRTPNLAWEIDGRQIAADAGIPAVLLINDLVATAAGIPMLRPEELAVLQAGSSGPAANRVLIAAGTGLGMALLPWTDGAWLAVPSEGGHADFAPRDEDEVALLRYLWQRQGGHVSVERVLSGPGLVNVYEFLRESGFAAESVHIRRRLETSEPAPVIAAAALAGDCRLCERALDMFVAVYGGVAGNLALSATARGGVFLGGGIAPKILPALRAGGFTRAFTGKGRFAPYLEGIPVQVILNDRTALLGAARRAADLLAPSVPTAPSAPSGPGCRPELTEAGPPAG